MNRPTRRAFLSGVLVGTGAPLTLGSTAWSRPSAGLSPDLGLRFGTRDHHHLVYHTDGVEPMHRREAPMSLEAILEHSVGVFRGTGVNIYEFNMGSYRMAHSLGLDPLVGPGAEPPLESTAAWRMYESLTYHLKRGMDPVQEIIRATQAAGVAFFAGVRMNDIHHSAYHWHPRFWVEHPEYRFNQKVAWDERGWGALDFAHQAVRDYRKGIMAAALARYDTDGLELDFNRFPLFFKNGEADRHRNTFTAYMREIRDLVEQTSVKRGHRVHLMVRVPPVAGQCHKIGLDVLRWIREELVDIAVCATPRYAEFEMPVEEFMEAARGRKVLVFAGFEPQFTEALSVLTLEMWRAAATHYWKAGVDGLHLFNNHYNNWQNLDEPHLKEIAWPALIEKANKRYQVTRRLKGVHMAEYGDFESYISYPKQLPLELTAGQAAKVKIFMDDKLANRPAIQLRLRMDRLTPSDQFTVAINGHRLSKVLRQPYTDRGARIHAVGSYEGGQGMDTQWVEADMPDPGWMREGANTVEVTLEQRNPALTLPLVVSNVELDVKYSK